jgi:hypothetical protein
MLSARDQLVKSKSNAIVITLLLTAVLIGPASYIGSRARADGAASLFELIVSPGGDPDPRDETSIAVSPINDQVIVGASKVIVGGGTFGRGDTRVSYYFSSDGGRSWGTGLLGLETSEKSWGRATYPSVAADLEGSFYLCVLMLDNLSFDSGVYVFKSTDNGQTFANPKPVVVDIGNATPRRADKCSMTVDASATSQFKGTVYAVWTSTGPDERGINATVVRFARRRAGDSAFSESKAIGHPGDMRGPSVATGPNGEVYGAWVGMPARTLLFNASTDGGDTFLPGLASLDITIHHYVGNLEGPNASFFISGLERANSFPSLDVDRSNGPNRGTVYVAWAETINGIDTDIFMCRVSPRAGTLPDISLPVKVNNDGNGTDQFFPWLSVDSSSGAVLVAFYDRRDDPGSVLMNVYLARSTDGGVSFAENTRITPVSSDPRVQAGVLGSTASAIGIGDYIGVVATRGKAHLMWADTRRGKQEILYSQLDFGSSLPPPPPNGLPSDSCESPRSITSLPYLDTLNTASATLSLQDPVSCTGSPDTNTVWYAFTPTISSTYGVDTSLSDYDTVVSVYTGVCGSLVRAACSDDFGNPPGRANRALLTFNATAGVTYLIEVSGKGSGGLLRIRAGYPTITGIEFTTGPDDSKALRITGAGFSVGTIAVTAQLDGEDIALPNIFDAGPTLPDGTETAFYASKKKLKKLVKRGSLLVTVESPAGSGNLSNSFLFTR